MEAQSANKIISTENFNKYNVSYPVVIKGWEIVQGLDASQRFLKIQFQKISDEILAFVINVTRLSSSNQVIEECAGITVDDVDRRKNNFSEVIPVAPNTEKVTLALDQYVLTSGQMGAADYENEIVSYEFKCFENALDAQAASRIIPRAKGYPIEKGSHWYCACGKLNWKKVSNCIACKLPKEEVFEKITPQTVQKERIEYAKKVDEADRKKRKTAKIIISAMVCVTVFIILISALCATVLPLSVVTTKGLRFEKNDSGAYTLTRCNSGNESITIPSKVRGVQVTEIGQQAFANNKNLISVSIPDSVSVIGIDAFYGCENLAEVELPDSLTSIDKAAFAYCESLSEIVIPAGVENMGSGVFYSTPNVTVFFNGNNQSYDWARDYSGRRKYVIWNHKEHGVTQDGIKWVLTNDDTVTVYDGENTQTLIVPAKVNGYDVTAIHSLAFSFYEFTSVELPDGLKTIGEYAFAECQQLTNITLPDSVTEIQEGAFESCLSMTNISLSNNLKRIGRYALYSCPKLTEICIPLSVSYIGKYALSTLNANVIVYCEAEQQPSGWESSWNSAVYNEIVWNYKAN